MPTETDWHANSVGASQNSNVLVPSQEHWPLAGHRSLRTLTSSPQPLCVISTLFLISEGTCLLTEPHFVSRHWIFVPAQCLEGYFAEQIQHCVVFQWIDVDAELCVFRENSVRWQSSFRYARQNVTVNGERIRFQKTNALARLMSLKWICLNVCQHLGLQMQFAQA